MPHNSSRFTTKMPLSMNKKKFNKSAIAFIKITHADMKITEEALRYLRNDILAHVEDPSEVDEVLLLVLTVLRDNGVRRIQRANLER